jgi:viologen exporter family transport system permease protein
MNTLRVSWLYFKVGVMNELQYRVNFFVQLLQSLIQVGTALVMLSLVYSHTDELNGWDQPQLLSLLGVQVLLGGVIHTFIQPNMERLMDDVQQGTLDYALTKPEDSQVLVSVRMVRIWQVVEVVSGLILLVVGLAGVESSIGVVDALAFGFALLLGVVLVYCFWLVITTGAFWVVRMEHVLELFEGVYPNRSLARRRVPGLAPLQRHLPRAGRFRRDGSRRGGHLALALADACARVRVRLRGVRVHTVALALRVTPLLRRFCITRNLTVT